jgi:hypothetical protein
MIQRRPLLWGIVITALALLNLWRWWPARGVAQGRSSVGPNLDLPATSIPSQRLLKRDLFTTRQAAVASARPPQVQVRLVPPTPVPAATLPDGSVMEATGGYRLLGVATREGQSQALIARGDQLFQLKPGDDLEGRYQVGNIDGEEVHLTEKQTGNTLKLHLWEEGTKP